MEKDILFNANMFSANYHSNRSPGGWGSCILGVLAAHCEYMDKESSLNLLSKSFSIDSL